MRRPIAHSASLAPTGGLSTATEAAIKNVVEARIQVVQEAMDQRRCWRLLEEEEVQKTIQELREDYKERKKRKKRHLHEERKELHERRSSPRSWHQPENALNLTCMAALRNDVFPALLRAMPSITKRRVLTLIDESWPAAGGHAAKGRALFDPPLVAAAHAAILENHKWSCEDACDILGERLQVSRRTIQTYLRMARRDG